MGTAFYSSVATPFFYVHLDEPTYLRCFTFLNMSVRISFVYKVSIVSPTSSSRAIQYLTSFHSHTLSLTHSLALISFVEFQKGRGG